MGRVYWHPLAQPTGTPGPDGMRAGVRIVHVTVEVFRRGWVDEFLRDGTALLTYDDGMCGWAKNSDLVAEAKWDAMMARDRLLVRLDLGRLRRAA